MKRVIRKIAVLCLLGLALAFVLGSAVRVSFAQSPVTFSEPEIANNFPDSLTFTITATNPDDQITGARFFYRLRNDTSETQQRIEFTTGNSVQLTYTWETANITTPPSAPVFYRWEVTDSSGNRTASQEWLYYYDDIRFEWQVLGDDQFAVWWHDRPESFGKEVFNTALLAFRDQKRLFGVAPDYPLRILIYNSDEEFARWHSYVSEFIGGEAFPSLGITAQIVPSDIIPEGTRYWLRDVIPHEISHLYFYQVATHPNTITPAWLNEGVAQYNEFNDYSSSRELAREAILAGHYIPLTALTGSFGYDEENVRLAYAESVSAVDFLVKSYGRQGLADLLNAYKAGAPDQRAFQEALGKSLTDFEQEFLNYMGAPPGKYGTPTPTAALVWVIPTPNYQVTRTAVPTIIAPSNTPIPPTHTPVPTSIPIDTPVAPGLGCPAGFAPLWIVMGIRLFSRRLS